MGNWNTYKLKDVCTKIGSGATPRGGKESYLEEGISLIRSQNVLDFEFATDGLAFISDEQARQLSNVSVEANDVLLNITGDSVARVCQVPSTVLPARVNQHVAIIRTDPTKLLPELLKYYLLNPSFKNFMLGRASAGATRNALTKGMIEGFEITVPGEIEEQKAVARILSSLDDKIELNRRMNATLEAMARALFKAWFVDFEPVRANKENRPSQSASPEIAKLFPSSFENGIPKGWKNVKLEELVETISVTHKFPKDEIIFLNTSDISEGHVLSHKYSQVEGLPGQAKKSIRKHDILYSEIRPGNRRYAYIDFDAEDFVVSTKLMVLRAKSSVDPVLLFYFLKSDEIVDHLQMLAESRSGTFPQITFDQLKRLEMLVPTDSVLKHYSSFLKSIFEKSNQNAKENQKLAEIRDSLLPRLIAGKISINEIYA